MSRNGSNPGGRISIRPLRGILALAILVMNRWSLSHWMYPEEHASPQNGALSFPSKQVNCECGQAWASDLEGALVSLDLVSMDGGERRM